MTATQRTRADVPPLTWELPTALGAVFLLAAVLILPAAQGVAAQLFGRGWVWPHGDAALISSIHGLLTGHPGIGLTPAAAARKVPGPGPVYGLAALGELALLAVTVCALVVWWRHLGPGARVGMATRAEAAAALGVARLRKARTIIRPDLHATDLSVAPTTGDRP
jgi:uncharacterized integral membrane protein